jgi:hypothetical protein
VETCRDICADSVHDNASDSLRMAISVNALRDSTRDRMVTLQVRFCEGCASYSVMGIRAATLPCSHWTRGMRTYEHRTSLGTLLRVVESATRSDLSRFAFGFL